MTKRKWKPKAKTKETQGAHFETLPVCSSQMSRPIVREISYNEQTGESRVSRTVREFDCTHFSSTRQTKFEPQPFERPIIAISAEAESSRSTSVPSDSSSSSLSSHCQPVRRDVSTAHKCSEPHSSDRNTRNSDCESTTSTNNNRPTHEEDDSNGVAIVKANFIGLIHYNKLQYFYLGALIYSVINIILLLQFLVYKQYDGLETNGIVATNSTTLDAVEVREATSEQNILLKFQSYNRLLSVEEPILATDDNEQDNLSQSATRRETNQQNSSAKSNAFIILLVLLPLSLMMLMVILLSLIEFNTTKWHAPKSSSWSTVHTYLECFGSFLAIALLTWPIYLQQLLNLEAAKNSPSFGIEAHEGENRTHLYQPIGSIMVILYSIFALLQGSTLVSKLLCTFWIAPSIVLHLSASEITSNANEFGGGERKQLSDILVFVAFFAGLLKRRLLSRAIGETFMGSNELVEAKVSLEQQRQQQETLLLSVLPAYVAEQVKRNMFKKITNIDGIDFPAQSEAQQQAQSFVVSLSSQQKPIAQLIGGGQQPTIKTPDQANRQNSLISRCTKSSTTYLTEAIVASTSAALKLSHLESKSSTQLASPSFYPTSNFTQPPGQARRGFNELYIRTYNNVSLLYGDIVGFTRLCTQLSSSQLVGVLNDLFSQFDNLAEQHKIMRIKILGDCYYGVAGIPEFAVLGAKRTGASGMAHLHGVGHEGGQKALSGGDNHAINCVNMGLDMIKYIKCLNIEHASERSSQPRTRNFDLSHSASDSSWPDQQQANKCPQQERPASSQQQQRPQCNLPPFELNMRIGVHTGHIHSGVIGLKKWQFDVWSNDVSIAMHCESSGVAGRVQVTEATLQHLQGEFTYEPAPRSQRDTYLADKSVRTYLICERTSSKQTANLIQAPGKAKESVSEKSRCCVSRSTATVDKDEDKIRAATIGTIKQILLAGEMANSSSLNAYALALDHQDFRPIGLEFCDSSQERMFLHRQLSCVAFLLSILLLLAVCISLLHSGLSLRFLAIELVQSSTISTCIAACCLLILLVFLLPLSCRLLTSGLNSVTSKRSSILRRSTVTNRTTATTTTNGATLLRQLEDNHQIGKTIDFCALIEGISRRTRELWHSFMQAKFDKTKPCLSSFLIALIISIVIIGQVYLSIASVCKQQQQHQSNTDQSLGLLLHQQVTVIMIIIATDLISSQLLSHKWKTTLILASSLLYLAFQITILCGSNQLSIMRIELIPGERNCETFFRFFGEPIFEHTKGAKQNLQQAANDNKSSNQKHVEFEDKLSLVILWSNGLLTLMLAFWSLNLQRQIEYSLRCNFLWRNRLNVDHEELEYISGINKVLLENILPSHVVHHYLTQPVSMDSMESNRKSGSARSVIRMSISQMKSLNSGQLATDCELYHEQHDSVAVMFASIPHFYEFYDESDISKQGLGCIALLNEIICDFDKLLLKNKFSRIEKIKTIGSTYMAAAGLRPLGQAAGSGMNSQSGSTGGGRNSTASQMSSSSTPLPMARNHVGNLLEANSCNQAPDTLSEFSIVDQRRLTMSQQKMNLICMIQFATSLMTTLNGINKQSFQVFKLRVGVNTGPVIAGIIGAQRPFYDIWGDCVNIASRMESLGEIGRIQVEERTAKILMECLCTETYSIKRRGPIDVKGKGGMVTYFVDKRQRQQQSATPSTQASNGELSAVTVVPATLQGNTN